MDRLSPYLILSCSIAGTRTLCERGKGKLTSCGNSIPQDDSIRSAVSIQPRESHAPSLLAATNGLRLRDGPASASEDSHKQLPSVPGGVSF
jgi:hypothetical protein